MVGSMMLAFLMILIGAVLIVVVPGVGWILGLLVMIAGIVFLLGGLAGGRRRRTTPTP
jgi:uncharacterized membrane protein